MRFTMLLLAVFFFSSGCDSPASPQGPSTPQWPALPPGAHSVPVEPLERVDSIASGFREPARVVIENQEEWQTFWETYEAGRFPKTAPPSVDFERHRIVTGIMGERNTGGHTISIAGAFENGGRTIVRVLETSPGSDCAVIQAITSPVAAAKIPRSTLPVEFVDASVTVPCN